MIEKAGEYNQASSSWPREYNIDVSIILTVPTKTSFFRLINGASRSRAGRYWWTGMQRMIISASGITSAGSVDFLSKHPACVWVISPVMPSVI